MERKLSTIFASDVVGFSKMMGENEEKTLETLGERRQVIDVVIAEHYGKILVKPETVSLLNSEAPSRQRSAQSRCRTGCRA